MKQLTSAIQNARMMGSLDCIDICATVLAKFKRLAVEPRLSEEQRNYCYRLANLVDVLTTNKASTIWKNLKLPADNEQELLGWIVPTPIGTLSASSAKLLSDAVASFNGQQNLSNLVASDKIKFASYICLRYDELLDYVQIPKDMQRIAETVRVEEVQKRTENLLNKCNKLLKEDFETGKLLSILVMIPLMSFRGVPAIAAHPELVKLRSNESILNMNLPVIVQRAFPDVENMRFLAELLKTPMNTETWFNQNNTWSQYLAIVNDMITYRRFDKREDGNIIDKAMSTMPSNMQRFVHNKFGFGSDEAYANQGGFDTTGGFAGQGYGGIDPNTGMPMGDPQWAGGGSYTQPRQAGSFSKGAQVGNNKRTTQQNNTGMGGKNQTGTKATGNQQQQQQYPQGGYNTPYGQQIPQQPGAYGQGYGQGYAQGYPQGYPGGVNAREVNPYAAKNQQQQQANMGYVGVQSRNAAILERLDSIMPRMINSTRGGNTLTLSIPALNGSWGFEVLGINAEDDNDPELIRESISFEDMLMQIPPNQEVMADVTSDMYAMKLTIPLALLLASNRKNKYSNKYYKEVLGFNRMEAKATVSDVREERAKHTAAHQASAGGTKLGADADFAETNAFGSAPAGVKFESKSVIHKPPTTVGAGSDITRPNILNSKEAEGKHTVRVRAVSQNDATDRTAEENSNPYATESKEILTEEDEDADSRERVRDNVVQFYSDKTNEAGNPPEASEVKV